MEQRYSINATKYVKLYNVQDYTVKRGDQLWHYGCMNNEIRYVFCGYFQ